MINRTQKNCAVVGETNVVKKVNKKNDKQNTKNCAIIGNVNVKKWTTKWTESPGTVFIIGRIGL